jgi:Methylamine utilisation protein MauE
MTRSILNRSNFIVFAAALSIFLYIYTATSKILDIDKFETVLANSPLIGEKALWVSWTIPFIEIIVSIFLLFPQLRKLGFLVSTFLMSAFTAYIGYMILFVPKLPCSCGGMISKLTWQQHFFFNSIFLTISVAGYLVSKKELKSLLQ